MAAAKKETKSIATVDVNNFIIQNVETTTTSEEIEEELDGLGTIPFDRVKWPTGGNTTFEVPDEENDDQLVPTDKITGVIVYHHPMNSRWEGNYNGGNEPPVCCAMDGKKGLNTQTGELIDCASCPFNQFETNGSTSGKACKNIHRLYIIRNDNPVPLLVALPPTSLNSFRNYLGKKLLIKGKKSSDVITEITLKKENSKNNMAFAKAVFKKVGDLNSKQIENAKSLSAMIKSIAKTEVIVTSDDYEMSNPSSEEQQPPANSQQNNISSAPMETPPVVPPTAPTTSVAQAAIPKQQQQNNDPFAFIDESNPFE